MWCKSLLVALVIGLLSPSAPSWAGTPSLDRILPAVARQIPGTMLDARGPSPSPDGTLRYEIKWMTPDGRVFWLSADANTGKIAPG
jgi:uncharacterized membrane protein YkoI